MVSHQFMSDCSGSVILVCLYTVFNKIGLYKTFSGCTLAVEWMSVALLDLIRH